MREQLKWYDDNADNSPWIDALAELRQRAAREGHCFQHVQAISQQALRRRLAASRRNGDGACRAYR